jgi:ribosome recycling factor
MVSGVSAEYHGEMTPLQNMATIRVQDALTIIVAPFEQDKKITKAITEAISAANLGFTATDQGNQVIVSVPPVTQEKREEYVRDAKEFAEEARISIRTARQDAMKAIENDEDASDDMKRDAKDAIQALVDEFNNKIEEHFKAKEKDLMTV